MILCGGSEYFEALCGADGRFAESNQKVVELQDDDPVALEVVLRYIYNISYSDSQQHLGVFSSGDHTRVYVAAKKYLLPELQAVALSELQKTMTIIEAGDLGFDSAEQIFELIELLSDQVQDDPFFERAINILLKNNLAELFKVRHFREWFVNAAGDGVVKTVTQATDWGFQALRATADGEVTPIRISACRTAGCAMIWGTQLSHGLLLASCPKCHMPHRSGNTRVISVDKMTC